MDRRGRDRYEYSYSSSEESDDYKRRSRSRSRHRRYIKKEVENDDRIKEEKVVNERGDLKKEIKEENEKSLLNVSLNDDEDDILKKMGLVNGFKSTKGKHVNGNVDGYSKIKATSKIFNILINKRGTHQKPIDVKLKK